MPPVLIEDSYIDGMKASTDDHTTAVASWGGVNNVTIRHNTLGNSPAGGAPTGIISAYQDFGASGWSCASAGNCWPNDNWTVVNNYFTGTTGEYEFTVGNSAGLPPNTNFKFGNNLFGDSVNINGGNSGIVAAWSSSPTNYWWNNVWYTPGNATKNGKPVPGPTDTGPAPGF